MQLEATEILYNDDVRSRLDARSAIQWIGEAVDAHHRGELTAPPRAIAELGGARYMFTTGHLQGSWYGYRSDDSFERDPGSQLVVLQDEATGLVRTIAIGDEIGPRRVGAIGAVAADALANPRAKSMAIIGCGKQAATQLWAISTIRNFEEIRVFSPNKERRESFAHRSREDMRLPCQAVQSPKEAIEGADVVVLATSSHEPVLDADWLTPGAYVATLGSKQAGAAEIDPKLVEMAGTIVTDSIDQLDAYSPPSFLANSAQRHRLISLGDVRSGVITRTHPDQVTLFISVGLAGTEVFLLDRISRRDNAEVPS